jgi:signal transduction histidine kinase
MAAVKVAACMRTAIQAAAYAVKQRSPQAPHLAMNVRDNTTSSAWAEDKPTGYEAAAFPRADAGRAAGLSPPASRVEGLLAAVVAACECMVQQTDLMAGLQAAVEQLGRFSGHDRAYVWELTEAQTVCVCIAEWGAPGIPRIADVAGTDRFAVADFDEVWTPLLAGHAYQSVTPAKTGANASLNQAVANRSDVMVPVFVGAQCWGCIGFDNCREERHYSAAEIQALRGAAAAVAAAVQRGASEAQQRAAERQRSDEALALNSLLEGVVQASRALLDASDFQQGLQRWLAFLAQAVGADAAMLGSFAAAPQAATLTSFSTYWARDGSPYTGQAVPVTRDFVGWSERLHRGEWVWAHRDDLQDPASVAFWVATHCTTNLLMPVVCNGRTVGWLGFDWRLRQAWRPAYSAALRTAADGVAAALHRQEAVQALLAERERRIAVEQTRADEAARHAARTLRHSRLLAAVAQSAEELLAARDLAPCLDAVLGRIGQVTAADRLALTRIDWTPEDAALHGRQEIVHEWTHGGAARQRDTAHRWIEMRRDDATWAELWAQLHSHGRGMTRIAELAEPFRSTQLALGVTWAVVYPVEVGGMLRGLLGLDYSTAIEDYDDADLAALKTVASTIADALWRQELEARALAAERARADESARLADLLGHVVSSSRTLIDADPQAFEPALKAWLGGFGQAVGAIRCTFYDQVDFENTGLRTVRMLAEWVRAGVGGSVPVSFAQPTVIAPRGAEPLMAQLTSGRTTAIHTDDTTPPMRDFLAQQGNATVVAVPLVMDGQPWGCLSFDHAERRDPQPGELAVLQTAADTLVAILKRNEAVRRMLAEREGRLAAEQQRNSELARANEALRESLDALAGAGGETAFMSRSLLRLQEELGAQAAYLFRSDGTGRRLRLLGRVTQGHFSTEPAADDPAMFTDGFDMVPALLADLKQRGRLLWRRVDAAAPVGADMPESTRWHLRMGHRANAVHALMVGERQVGFIGLVFDTDVPPREAELDLAHALCQPITLSLELARLSRLAQRGSEQNAVLAERSRLAREIHDGIAQSFLAIQLQLDTLAPRTQRQLPVMQALQSARHGLTEARRAVAALRPQGLLNNDLPKALRRLLDQLSSHTPLKCVLDSPPAWQGLPADVEDNLFRIVQEAANNVLKHAAASQLRVELSQTAGEATVLIADDGTGFDIAHLPAGHGFGLESMQQRARLIGAGIDWLSQPGKGTQVLVSWSAPASSAPSTAPRAGLAQRSSSSNKR